MSITGSEQWMYSSGASFYDYEIENSLRFEDGSTANLTRTPSSSGNRQTWTFSAWLKRGNLGATSDSVQTIFSSKLNPSGAGNNVTAISIRNDDTFEVMDFLSGGFNWGFRTLGKFRDVSSWYHLVVECDSTQATDSDRVKLYINGVLQSVETYPGQPSSYPNQNENTNINFTYVHYIGIDGSGNRWDGYMADVNLIDGTALDPTSFGEPKSGVWIPKDTSGLTFGTNGFRLEFGDSAAIGDDTSGNGNDYTANNLSVHDVVPDSPTVNYAVVNPLARSAQDFRVTLSEGNLNIQGVTNSDSNFNTRFATIPLPSSGKYYAECRAYVISNNGNAGAFGVVDPDAFDANEPSSKVLYDFTGGEGFDGVRINLYLNTLQAISDGTASGGEITGLTATSYILKLALDIDNGKVFVGYDGVWLNSADPAAGTGETATRNFTTSDVIAITTVANVNSIITGNWANFGQDSTFGGNVTSGGNSDENGYGDFKYSVPSGFLALNTANLPEPAITPLDDDIPADYFNTVLYSGTDSTQSVTVGFQPDFLWLKCRNSSGNNHFLVDSVRGEGTNMMGALFSNLRDGEETTTNSSNSTYGIISSLDSDGFTVDAGATNSGATNQIGRTYVGWNWLAGSTAVSNTDGSITSSVSANTEAGFSIVSYTGTNSAATIGHGLSQAPDMIIAKRRSGTDDWVCYHSALTSAKDKYMVLNKTNAEATLSNFWGTSTPDSSVFGALGGYAHNKSGSDFIAYCFASIEGYSKFGSYTGNGNADGTFVYTNFLPAWIMVKRSSGASSASGWFIADNARNISNVVDNKLDANSNEEENDAATIGVSGSNDFDFLSNGFKPRATNAGTNISGNTYIYMAFAEMPQKYANAR